jgi:hypothetical protein
MAYYENCNWKTILPWAIFSNTSLSVEIDTHLYFYVSYHIFIYITFASVTTYIDYHLVDITLDILVIENLMPDL